MPILTRAQRQKIVEKKIETFEITKDYRNMEHEDEIQVEEE